MAIPPIVVVGTGSIGRRHLAAIRARDPRAALALPARPERRAELERDGFTVVSSLAEAREKGARGAIVATDTARHVADAEAALAADLFALIEKPIAPTATEARRLAAQTERVRVAYCLRLDAGLARFRELLPRIGRPFFVRVECQSYLPDWRPDDDHRRGYAARPDEGGVLRDLSHDVDYATLCFGPPAAVTALVTSGERLEIESDAAVDLLWRAPGDVTVSLRLDYLARHGRRSMTAFGERGELRWNAVEKTIELRIAGGTSEVDRYAQTRDELMGAQIDAFAGVIDGRSSSPLATLEEGVLAAAIADAARTSNGSLVAVSPTERFP